MQPRLTPSSTSCSPGCMNAETAAARFRSHSLIFQRRRGASARHHFHIHEIQVRTHRLPLICESLPLPSHIHCCSHFFRDVIVAAGCDSTAAAQLRSLLPTALRIAFECPFSEVQLSRNFELAPSISARNSMHYSTAALIPRRL
jgi:hypothetical protein